MRILIMLSLVSCAGVRPRYSFNQPVKRLTPQQLHQERVEKCVHAFLDKGVLFFEASRECADRIHRDKRI